MFVRRLGLRTTAVVAVVMALFLLAVSQLSAPGNASPGFGPSVDSPVIAAVHASCESDDRTPPGEQARDDARVPVATSPLRPPLDTAGILLPCPHPATVFARVPAGAVTLPDVGSTRSGVLRI